MKGEAVAHLDKSEAGKHRILALFSLYLSSFTETDNSGTEIPVTAFSVETSYADVNVRM